MTNDISLDGNSLHRYLADRRVRQLRGHTSCGLCGVEDLKTYALLLCASASPNPCVPAPFSPR